jgi:hypothetical protein
MSEQRELTQAQELGRLAAERLDQELRAVEEREREARLARLRADPAAEPASSVKADARPEADSGEIWRLRHDNERLAYFHRAVLSSRGWRVLQWARRPFGRAW